MFAIALIGNKGTTRGVVGGVTRIAITVGVIMGGAALALILFLTGGDDDTTADVVAAAGEQPLLYEIERSPDVPILPFDDNPDPNQCGIPVRWGSDGQAYLTGVWEGDLIQPEVYLYDSHLRVDVKGKAPHGSEVQILFFQENPVLDYYLVKTPDGVEGWVPAVFLSFDPVL